MEIAGYNSRVHAADTFMAMNVGRLAGIKTLYSVCSIVRWSDAEPLSRLDWFLYTVYSLPCIPINTRAFVTRQ